MTRIGTGAAAFEADISTETGSPDGVAVEPAVICSVHDAPPARFSGQTTPPGGRGPVTTVTRSGDETYHVSMLAGIVAFVFVMVTIPELPGFPAVKDSEVGETESVASDATELSSTLSC